MGCCGSKSKKEYTQHNYQHESTTMSREEIESLVKALTENKKSFYYHLLLLLLLELPLEIDLHMWYLKEVETIWPLYLKDKPKDDVCFICGRGFDFFFFLHFYVGTHSDNKKPVIKSWLLEQIKSLKIDYYIHHGGGRITCNFNKNKKVVRKYPPYE
jgi:hypothetical protein